MKVSLSYKKLSEILYYVLSKMYINIQNKVPHFFLNVSETLHPKLCNLLKYVHDAITKSA